MCLGSAGTSRNVAQCTIFLVMLMLFSTICCLGTPWPASSGPGDDPDLPFYATFSLPAALCAAVWVDFRCPVFVLWVVCCVFVFAYRDFIITLCLGFILVLLLVLLHVLDKEAWVFQWGLPASSWASGGLSPARPRVGGLPSGPLGYCGTLPCEYYN